MNSRESIVDSPRTPINQSQQHPNLADLRKLQLMVTPGI
jgi:hypothetical protein